MGEETSLWKTVEVGRDLAHKQHQAGRLELERLQRCLRAAPCGTRDSAQPASSFISIVGLIMAGKGLYSMRSWSCTRRVSSVL